MADIESKEKILLEFIFGNQIRGFIIMFYKHANRSRIALLSAFAHAAKLKSLNGFGVIIFHDTSPFFGVNVKFVKERYPTISKMVQMAGSNKETKGLKKTMGKMSDKSCRLNEIAKVNISYLRKYIWKKLANFQVPVKAEKF